MIPSFSYSSRELEHHCRHLGSIRAGWLLDRQAGRTNFARGKVASAGPALPVRGVPSCRGRRPIEGASKPAVIAAP